MFKNLRKKVLWISMLVVLPMVFGLVSNALATPEPPLGSERLSGPAIVGTVTITPTSASFIGSCKGNEVIFSSGGSFDLSTITESTLADFRLSGAGPAGCFSSGGEDVIVNTVIKFTNLGSQITAKVVLMFVVPR